MERLIVVNNSLFSYNPIIDLFLFTRQKTARLCSWDEWRGIKLSRHFGRAVVYWMRYRGAYPGRAKRIPQEFCILRPRQIC